MEKASSILGLVRGLVAAGVLVGALAAAAEEGKKGKISSTTTDAEAALPGDEGAAKKDDAGKDDATKDDAKKDAPDKDDAKPAKKGSKKSAGKKAAGGTTGGGLKSTGAGAKSGYATGGGGFSGNGGVAGNKAPVPFIPGGVPLNGISSGGGAATAAGGATATSRSSTPDGTDASSSGGTQNGSFPLARNVSDLVELTNAERRKQNLPELTLNATLMQMARQHSATMARLNTMSHTLEGVTFAQRVQASGYRALAAGENIAAGQRSAAEAVEDWMNSPGHRANILNAQFTEIGVAVVTSATGFPYYTQIFGRPSN